MKRLLLCGVYEEIYNDEVMNNSKRNVEFSANIFQLKLINGFRNKNIPIDIISAPFISPFPNRYRKPFFKKFSKPSNSDIKYVCFNNFWGIRNFSRKKMCFNALKKFIALQDSEKILYVYSVHTPFIEAAVKAKKKDKNIKICLIVPDLPQYMNLEKKKSLLYKCFKKIDSTKFYKLNSFVDSYMILTESMKEELKIGEKPYIVVEGIFGGKNENQSVEKKRKQILYAGKIEEDFGILNLINAFKLINDQEAKLIICGSGQAYREVENSIKGDNRIVYKGQVSPEAASILMMESGILVNPRQNNSEYTKFSFPSKTIEYLSTGNAVVGYKLDGIPEIYSNFMFLVRDSSINSLKNILNDVLQAEQSEIDNRATLALMYFQKELSIDNVIYKLIKMNGDLHE